MGVTQLKIQEFMYYCDTEHCVFSRFIESLPDLEELESKLNAYYALEKDAKRYPVIVINNYNAE